MTGDDGRRNGVGQRKKKDAWNPDVCLDAVVVGPSIKLCVAFE